MSLALLLALLPCAFGGYNRALWSWTKCPINSSALNQIVLQEKLAFTDKRQTPPQLGILHQHLAIAAAPYMIARQFEASRTAKPLVLTFFGTPGVGKSMMERRIRSLIFTRKSDPQSVEEDGVLFFSNEDFDEENIVKIRNSLIDRISNQVYNCPKSMIVFDEMQHAPKDLFIGSLLAMVGASQPVRIKNRNVDFSRCVFIFVTNTGFQELNKRYFELRSQSLSREDIQSAHFDDIRTEIKALQPTLYEHHGTAGFVPFLPAEQAQLQSAFQIYIEALGEGGLDGHPGKTLKIVTSPSMDSVTRCLAFEHLEPVADTDFESSKHGLDILSSVVGHIYAPLDRALQRKPKGIEFLVTIRKEAFKNAEGCKIEVEVVELRSRGPNEL